MTGRGIRAARSVRKLRRARSGGNGLWPSNFHGMRGITVAVRFEHGGYRCNAAGGRLTARERPVILWLKTSQKRLVGTGS